MIKSAKLHIIFGMMFFIVMFVVVSKQRIDLNNYEEECYEYEQIPYVRNWTFQKHSACCFGWCSIFDKCEIFNETYFYNSTKNGKCIKYILVRTV